VPQLPCETGFLIVHPGGGPPSLLEPLLLPVVAPLAEPDAPDWASVEPESRSIGPPLDAPDAPETAPEPRALPDPAEVPLPEVPLVPALAPLLDPLDTPEELPLPSCVLDPPQATRAGTTRDARAARCRARVTMKAFMARSSQLVCPADWRMSPDACGCRGVTRASRALRPWHRVARSRRREPSGGGRSPYTTRMRAPGHLRLSQRVA
jgi:hypothetical protein